MKPRINTWKKGGPVKRRPVKRTSAVATKVATKKKASSGIDVLLGSIKKSSKTKKKSDKPLVILEGRAEQLLHLQQMKAQSKTLKGAIDALEGEIFPKIEDLRLAVNREQNQYIGSVHVQATPGDVNAGQALYYIMNKYTGFNPTESSSDEELQEDCDGEATLKDEAIQAIASSLNVGHEEAEGLLDQRMEVSHSISLEEAALKDPKVVQVLQMHLAQHLVSKTVMKPTKTFHERSSFESVDASIMDALAEIGLVKRYKAVLKPSGAPKA